MQTQFNTATHAAQYNEVAKFWAILRRGIGIGNISRDGSYVNFVKGVDFNSDALKDIARLMDNIQGQAKTLQPH